MRSYLSYRSAGLAGGEKTRTDEKLSQTSWVTFKAEEGKFSAGKNVEGAGKKATEAENLYWTFLIIHFILWIIGFQFMEKAL